MPVSVIGWLIAPLPQSVGILSYMNNFTCFLGYWVVIVEVQLTLCLCHELLEGQGAVGVGLRLWFQCVYSGVPTELVHSDVLKDLRIDGLAMY